MPPPVTSANSVELAAGRAHNGHSERALLPPPKAFVAAPALRNTGSAYPSAHPSTHAPTHPPTAAAAGAAPAGEPTPYLHISRALDLLDGTTKRLRKSGKAPHWPPLHRSV